MPQQADRARHERQIIRQRRATVERLGYPGAQQFSHLHHLVGGARGPRPISIATFSPEFRTSAARFRSSSRGLTAGTLKPSEENTAPWARGGS